MHRTLHAVITLVAIIAIACLEWKALSMGIDGQLFGLVIATIGGMAGYSFKTIRN